MSALQQEWLALQAQHERYEGLALVVKLAAVAVCFLVSETTLAVSLLALLWLQEAVLKTFQGQLGDRLLVVEAGIKSGEGVPAMQLHSDWLASRPRGSGLALQYLKSALRPTVASPYPLLMLLSVVV